MKHPQYVNFKSLAILAAGSIRGLLTCLITLLYLPVKQNVSPRFHLEHGAT